MSRRPPQDVICDHVVSSQIGVVLEEQQRCDVSHGEVELVVLAHGIYRREPGLYPCELRRRGEVVIDRTVLLRVDGLADPEEGELHVVIAEVGGSNAVIRSQHEIPLVREQVVEHPFQELACCLFYFCIGAK